jgi:hypothetical protein
MGNWLTNSSSLKRRALAKVRHFNENSESCCGEIDNDIYIQKSLLMHLKRRNDQENLLRMMSHELSHMYNEQHKFSMPIDDILKRFNERVLHKTVKTQSIILFMRANPKLLGHLGPARHKCSAKEFSVERRVSGCKSLTGREDWGRAFLQQCQHEAAKNNYVFSSD